MIGDLLAARWWWSPLAAAWIVIAAGLSAALPERPVLHDLHHAPDRAVLVDIIDTAQRPHNGVTVVGCGEIVARERLGGHAWRFLLEDVHDDCALRAVRYDGIMPAMSAAAVIPAEATSTDVTLVLPTWRAGGLGVTLDLDLVPGRFYVSDVRWPSGADEAGIQSRDQIVAVDGIRVDGLDIDAFRALVAGPVGETVQVTLGHDVRTRTVSVRRTHLSGSR